MEEITEFINNPLFSDFYSLMETEYNPKITIEYSGDKILLGWNLKFRKSGRALCTLYPKNGYFSVMVVVGRKEKKRVEALLPKMSEEVQKIYRETKEGMNQRWLIIDLKKSDEVYGDVLKIISIRRESR